GSFGLCLFPCYSSGTSYVRIQSDYVTFNSPSTNYLFTDIRKSSTLMNMYRDRVVLGADITKASVALQNATVWALAINNGSNAAVAGSYSSDTMGLIFAGAQLTSTDIATLCDACDTLLTAIQNLKIIAQDSCDGTVIDTSKWTTTNLDSNITFSQNDALICDSYGISINDYYRNKIVNSTVLNWGVWRFSAQFIASQGTNSYSIVALKDTNTFYPAGNTIQLKADLANSSRFQINTVGNVTPYDVVAFNDFSIVKLIVSPTHKISLYSWVNDAWTQIGVSQNYNFGSLQLCLSSKGAQICTISIRDLFITNKDFKTFIP
ncbi:MAG: hypothetical protein ABIP51_24055, partial [Bacteroidia bacterium]